MPDAPLRLALAQANPTAGDVEANVRSAASLVTEAADRGAKLVAFPELFLTGYELAILASTPSAWIEADDARLLPIRRLCEERGVSVVLGAALRARDGARNIAALICTPRGDLTYSLKEHLHGSETRFFRPGTPAPPFDVMGWRVAIGICFDVSRPRHAEYAAAAGADLYLASSLYWTGEERRVDLHLGARAMDNRIFTALANYAGSTGGHASIGGSGAWGPSGEVVLRAPDAEERLVVVDLEPAELRRYRVDAGA